MGAILVFPTLAFEGLLFLIQLYCGTYGDFGPVMALLVVTLPVVLPGIGALLDRRRARATGGGPSSAVVAIVSMVAIAAFHALVLYLTVLAGEATSSGDC